jgi:hypothetical protein
LLLFPERFSSGQFLNGAGSSITTGGGTKSRQWPRMGLATEVANPWPIRARIGVLNQQLLWGGSVSRARRVSLGTENSGSREARHDRREIETIIW